MLHIGPIANKSQGASQKKPLLSLVSQMYWILFQLSFGERSELHFELVASQSLGMYSHNIHGRPMQEGQNQDIPPYIQNR